jgi:hypothetical protein
VSSVPIISIVLRRPRTASHPSVTPGTPSAPHAQVVELRRVDQQKLGVVYGLFQTKLALLSEVTARGRGLTDEAIGPLLEAQVYRKFLHQPYPPEVRPG